MLTDAQLQIIVTGAVACILGYMQYRMGKKIDASDKKIDAVSTVVDDVKMATDGLTTKQVESAKKEATATATLDERERVANQKMEIDAAVHAAKSTVAVSVPTPNPNAPPTDIEVNVIETRRDVKDIKEDTGEIKAKVIDAVTSGVNEAVQDAKDKTQSEAKKKPDSL